MGNPMNQFFLKSDHPLESYGVIDILISTLYPLFIPHCSKAQNGPTTQQKEHLDHFINILRGFDVTTVKQCGAVWHHFQDLKFCNSRGHTTHRGPLNFGLDPI